MTSPGDAAATAVLMDELQPFEPLVFTQSVAAEAEQARAAIDKTIMPDRNSRVVLLGDMQTQGRDMGTLHWVEKENVLGAVGEALKSSGRSYSSSEAARNNSR